MKKPIYFGIDYLMNKELTDEDLYLLLDKHALIYSLLAAEFAEANIVKEPDEIFKICEKENWMYNYFWSTNEMKSFTNKLIKVYKNVYNYSEQRCKQEAEMWIVMYGLTNIRNKGSKQYILD